MYGVIGVEGVVGLQDKVSSVKHHYLLKFMCT